MDQIPHDVEKLLKEIRSSKELPKQAGLLKYDYYASYEDLFIAFLPLFVFGLAMIVVCFRGGEPWGIYSAIIFVFCFVVSIISVIGWIQRRKGLIFILLTPKYLISTHGTTKCYDWQSMSEVYFGSSAKIDGKSIIVTNWPINKPLSGLSIYKSDDLAIRLEKRGSTIKFSFKGEDNQPIDRSISDLSVLEPYLKATIEGGNRTISFSYQGKKESIDIPTGVNIQTIAQFINLYWAKLNPGAKRKGVIYL